MQRVTITSHQIRASTITLVDHQIHYLRRVLRLGEGDRFIALNGTGKGWIAILTALPEQAYIVAPWQAQNELPILLHLVMAMPKIGMDDIVRQVTELGVSSIQLVASDRTLLKPSAKKIDRWCRIAQEATEQCERQWVPLIYPPKPLSESLSKNSGVTRWICVARQQEDRFYPHLLTALLSEGLNIPPMVAHKRAGISSSFFPNAHKAPEAPKVSAAPNTPTVEVSTPNDLTPEEISEVSVSIAIGPEGGWTIPESQMAIALGYQPVSLGPRILRTTTAPLAAISLIAAVFEHQGRNKIKIS